MFGLYLLDIYVEQLRINKEVYIDTGGSTLVAKVVFLNFPAAEVVERERSNKDEKIYIYEFKNGQSIHFCMPSEELVKKMKRVPVKIGVFKLDDSFPICYVHSLLSGCACDLGSVCVEKPVPYVFKGPFDLVDPGKSFAGQLELEITISNLGRNLITAFVLAPNCFVFKNEPEGPEYKCNSKDTKSSTLGGIASSGDNSTNTAGILIDRLLDTAPPGNLMRDVAGVSPVVERLALGSPPPKVRLAPLVDPTVAIKKKGKKGKRKKA